MADMTIRVRFAPSPTGYLHVGGARTALFNWLLARKGGGRFVVRIEDTHTARNVIGAERMILEDLRWLGLEWDEGPEKGGAYGPYVQSERFEIHRDHVRRLLGAGKAYYAFETGDELQAMRDRAAAEKRDFRYPRPDPVPTDAEAERARAEGRPVVVRFVTPREDVTVRDQIMGNVTITADELDDFIILKADGVPTYHLANVVDDALMRITHVLRGQEFLAQTPRHILLQRAFGYPTPTYAHLPLIMDMKGRKLSKRDGDVEVHAFRRAGYLPEALLNFIALLGWSPGEDREKMTLDEMIQLFDVGRINRANAKFDRHKLLAFNTDAAAAAAPDRLLAGFKDWIGLNETSFARCNDDELRAVLGVCAGFRTFADVEAKAGFIFRPDEAIEYDPAAVKKVLQKGENAGVKMLQLLLPRLEAHEKWSAEDLEALLNRVCEEQGVKMGKVAQPLRVAVSGSTVSPAIGETLFLLGKEGTATRVEQCLSRVDFPADTET